jgi:hypothetical protein
MLKRACSSSGLDASFDALLNGLELHFHRWFPHRDFPAGSSGDAKLRRHPGGVHPRGTADEESDRYAGDQKKQTEE